MKAWTKEDGFIIDVCSGNPAECYHPDIAAHYSTDVPSNAENGDVFLNGVLTKRETPAAPAVDIQQTPAKVSPVEFKLLFTSQERVAIYGSADPIVKDFLSILDDPRLTHINLGLPSTASALAYMESLGLIAAGRSSEIIAGNVQ